jgi:hypothetical protein
MTSVIPSTSRAPVNITPPIFPSTSSSVNMSSPTSSSSNPPSSSRITFSNNTKKFHLSESSSEEGGEEEEEDSSNSKSDADEEGEGEEGVSSNTEETETEEDEERLQSGVNRISVVGEFEHRIGDGDDNEEAEDDREEERVEDVDAVVIKRDKKGKSRSSTITPSSILPSPGNTPTTGSKKVKVILDSPKSFSEGLTSENSATVTDIDRDRSPSGGEEPSPPMKRVGSQVM